MDIIVLYALPYLESLNLLNKKKQKKKRKEMKKKRKIL